MASKIVALLVLQASWQQKPTMSFLGKVQQKLFKDALMNIHDL